RGEAVLAMHLCRGNGGRGPHAPAGWHTEGGYDRIAEQLFSTLNVDRFLLEYDSDRAGTFEPLRFMPKGKIVVLGLVSSKLRELEPADAIVRRIEQAAKHMPLENLALSPQCGFASTAPGNPLTTDEQRRKLELVVEVARKVWG
ncbi:MAG: 5-methyltetrahydropteroyltriglutamate--homocysteine S-methyltransferase, partial [Chloroflexota bacterium]